VNGGGRCEAASAGESLPPSQPGCFQRGESHHAHPARRWQQDETTRFGREAFAGMERLIGPLHEESYVLMHAVDGDAYGYGGRTQNGRLAVAHPG